MEEKFMLSFDLPREMAAVRSKLHRKLKKMKAEMIHESFWQHSDLNKLVDIALTIKKFGGRAKY